MRSREVVGKEILRRVVGQVLVISVKKLCCLIEIEAAFVAYSARHQRLFYKRITDRPQLASTNKKVSLHQQGAVVELQEGLTEQQDENFLVRSL